MLGGIHLLMKANSYLTIYTTCVSMKIRQTIKATIQIAVSNKFEEKLPCKIEHKDM